MMSHSLTSDPKPLVYIAHPVSGRTNANIIHASKWFRWAAKLETVIPVAPYIATVMALDDGNPDERLTGMAISGRILRMCDEVWLCGYEISPGMNEEMQAARSHGIPVVDLTGHILPSDMIGGPAWE